MRAIFPIAIIVIALVLAGCNVPLPDSAPHMLNSRAPLAYGSDCIDSDVKLNTNAHFVKGFVFAEGDVEYDYCEGGALKELVCVFGTKRGVRINCPLGCRNGACVKADMTNKLFAPKKTVPTEVKWCSDADGQDSYRAASVTTNTETKADTCQKKTAERVVTAESCDGSDCSVLEATCSEKFIITMVEISCEDGCANGACKTA